MKYIKNQKDSEENWSEFHEQICEKLKKCGIARLRSSLTVFDVVKGISLSASIYEIALESISASLSTNLLGFAFSALLKFPETTSAPVLPPPFLVALNKLPIGKRDILPLRLQSDKVMKEAREIVCHTLLEMEEAEFRHLFLICGVLVAYLENYMLASPLCLEGQRQAFKDLPPSAVRLMDALLSINPELRGTAISALASELLQSKLLISNDKYEKKAYVMPRHLDDKVASLHLGDLLEPSLLNFSKIKLTTLIPVECPYKPALYRY
ncbi:Adenosylhomocysteinase [Capsicum baccatum]|uniref:Adenosylhomocysteinase n=1 Tax=Capsicum baccatum TaxID=33114 RepID=A0A2G2XFK7_CAPBA|nr:Adenosylhomocysteinase [Capsicum baccatum]